MTGRRRAVRSLAAGSVLLCLLGTVVAPALAHGGSLGASSRQPVTIPTWLVLTTGGAAVGASFLLASLVTDRQFIDEIESWRRGLPSAETVVTAGTPLVRVAGVALLAITIAGCLLGPQAPLANLGILVVWVGWWAGFTMSTYLLGNIWPALNPWRTLTAPLPSLDVSYPGVGVWPATVALLGLVWLEVVSPIADAPTVLASVIVAYTVVTVAGAVALGTDVWFDRVDPVARVFRHYGHVAPLQRDGDGFSLRLPGSGLTDLDLTDRSEVAFVVALLWVTTFDGFVATPAWRGIVDLASPPIPLAALYPLALVGGFGLFLTAFYAASRASKRISDTYLTERELARQFAPSLLAIAAGYHVAHYLGYFLSLAPALAVVASAPLSPPIDVPVLLLPSWFETLGMVAILVGHVLAIWVAHATAFDILPGRLQAIRSQYPFIAVMVFYTMTSLWIIAQPEVTPP
jgi:hypothetical protein